MIRTLFYFFIMLLAFSSCNQANKNSQSEAEHAHDDISLKLLAYSDDFELFAEADPFATGKESSILAHFTHLENFKALSQGKVTVSLIIGTKGIKQSLESPERPGIYRFSLKPEFAGTGKLIFEIEGQNAKSAVIVENITVYADDHTAIHEAEKLAPQQPDAVPYTKEQSWQIDFAMTAIDPQPFSEIIKTTGEILPAQGDEMVVTANTNGIVTFSGNKAVVGTSVRAGEMLFAISGKNLTDGNTETRFTQAKVAYDKAKADYDRAQELVKDNIVSQKDFQDIKARYETEQANYNNLSRNYQSGGQKVVSPISGFMKNILVAEGQYVSIGQPIASVSQNRSLVLKAEVSQKYFSKLPLISSANFKTAYDNKTYSIESLNGKLLSYGKSNDANTLFIPVTFSFDNRGEVVPGSLVDVYLKLQPFDGAIVIPVSALIEEQGVFYAYVQTGGESFVKRELKMGGSDGINVQVLAGLNDGERVVTKGAYQIKLATASGAIPAHGHAH